MNSLDEQAIRRRFQRRAADISGANFLLQRSADTLLERLELLAMRPDRVLDLGAGSGTMSKLLARHYRPAQLLCVDFSPAMLRRCQRTLPFFSKKNLICANANALPLASASVDLAVANQLLPWVARPDALLREAHRVLVPDGAFFFASLGPDSFIELRNTWRDCAGAAPRVPDFLDMHDIGDAIGRAGFGEAVLDVERITVNYETMAALWRDLRLSASGNALSGRRKGLATPALFKSIEANYPRYPSGQGHPVTIELVFGHAFASRKMVDSDTLGEVNVSLGSIGHRR